MSRIRGPYVRFCERDEANLISSLTLLDIFSQWCEGGSVDQSTREAIFREVKKEPYAVTLGMELVELEAGFSAVEMAYRPVVMDNLFSRAHGGAIFSLIDEAFETVCQSCGEVTVALNVSLNYVATPSPGARLRAEAREVTSTRKTATYDIRVTADSGELIAVCQALAYRTGKPLPFL